MLAITLIPSITKSELSSELQYTHCVGCQFLVRVCADVVSALREVS